MTSEMGTERDILIRAGVKSNTFRAGTVDLSVMGTFSTEDVTDVIEMLSMTIRMVKRQAALPIEKGAHHANATSATSAQATPEDMAPDAPKDR